MEKDRHSKVMAIAALIIAVIGLGMGFAAFTNTLTISASASVTPNSSSFSVDFSSSDTALSTDPVKPTVVGIPETSATSATINNTTNPNAPTISNLSAAFTEPGQSATYTFYAYNNGEYAAYLRSISLAAVEGSDTKKCVVSEVQEGETKATDALVQQACSGIVLTVTAGPTTTDPDNTITTTGSKTDITGHGIATSKAEKITVKIEYSSTAERADGPFTVQFGDISLLYSSVDGGTEGA